MAATGWTPRWKRPWRILTSILESVGRSVQDDDQRASNGQAFKVELVFQHPSSSTLICGAFAVRKLCCLLGLLFIIGCGGTPSGPVLVPATGTVLFKGKPISGATVSMTGEKGQLSTGFTDSEGKFRMTTGGRPGVPVGKAKVGITKAAATPTKDVKKLTPEDMLNMQKSGGGVATELVAKSEIPEKYADVDKSGLEAVVDKDGKNNVFEFVLVE